MIGPFPRRLLSVQFEVHFRECIKDHLMTVMMTADSENGFNVAVYAIVRYKLR